jgi:hypothetical protein
MGKAPNNSMRDVILQSRDISLLRDLFESRVMRTSHVASLHFGGNAETAKKRLQKLQAAGLLSKRPRHPYEPAVFYLTPKAFRLLRDDGHLADLPRLSQRSFERRVQVSERTLEHELAVLNVKAAMVAAINGTKRFKIAQFSTWPLLYELPIERSAIDPTASGVMYLKPDAFVRVHEDEGDTVSEHVFFIEVDRSTESQGVLAAKGPAYLEAHRSGAVAELLGGIRDEYKAYPFRVLFVVENEARRDSTIERLLANQPPTLTQVWLTTSREAIADPLGQIWIRPRDHREFHSNQQPHTTSHVPRLKLFED